MHYRNYTDETVEFGDGIQLICGKNAQGKTNLLEAIYYCSTMRSHRTLQDQHLIQKEEASFLIDLSLQRGRQKEQLRVCVNEKGKNLFNVATHQTDVAETFATLARRLKSVTKSSTRKENTSMPPASQ